MRTNAHLGADCFGIAANIGSIGMQLNLFAIDNDQGRCLHNIILAEQLGIFFCINFFKGQGGFLQYSSCHLAVRASLGGKKQAFLAGQGSSGQRFSRLGRHMFNRLVRMTQIVKLAVFKFLSLAVIPVLNRTIVARNAAVNFGCPSAVWANILLAAQIAMITAN